MNKQIITLATGKKLYVDLAVNLARSFYKWNANSGISFLIVTDSPHFIPNDVLNYVQVITIKAGELGEGFTPKLYLDRLAPEGQTLFIDSDCLIFGKLDAVFEKFKGKRVSVIGSYIADGEWFGDIEPICQKFNIPHIPKFNGGIYYLEKSAEATAVYDTARQLVERYDEIGFTRLRNRPNDEVIMALSMQLHGMVPIKDEGDIMSDPQACPGGYKIDVISGERWLINPPLPHPLHQNWYPFEKVSPLVFHFLGFYTQHYAYQAECYRLEKYLKKELNWLTELKAKATIVWPGKAKITFKNKLRPLYRTIFGVRKDNPIRKNNIDGYQHHYSYI